ncbi:LamG domain-containing protein, partial [bacterium]|nr:LamG domain-containing protein [bacterium]
DTGWHHVAGVINGTTMYLYVDGDEKATKSLGTSPIVDSGGSAYIGKSYSDLATDYFDGYIDEVAIYNYAKPAKQIAIDAREGQPWSPWSHSYYKNGDEDDVVLFADDFNDNTVDASDWDVIAGIGSWSEGNDDTTHDSGIITCSTAGCVIASNSNWYDEQVTVRIKFKTDGEAGIAYRWTNADGGHVVYMDSLADKVYIYTIKSTGVKDDLAAVSESLTIDTGIWYTLKVTSNGTQDRIYVNSESPCITYSNAAAKGKAGLYNSTGDAAIFDDFKVHPIDRYVRYEATLTDNLDKDTTPYLYRVKLNYENIAEDTLWSKIWQDKYGLHVNDVPAEVTWAPKDEDSLLTWSVLNCADIDLADTTWCYNLENYDDDRITPFNNPDGGLRVFVEVPVPVTDYVNLKFGYRTALTTPVTWPPNKTDYTWDDGDGWIMFIPGTDGVCDREYTCSDTEVWKCTFTEDQLTANFSKEAGYILWAQAASSGGNIEEEPLGFTPIDGDRADTSIIHMMKDITPPGSSNTSGGWPWQAGESGYQPVAGRDNDNWIGIEKDPDARLRIKGVQSSSNPEGTETWYINSSNTWINFDSSQNDSGILVSVEDKNPDVTRTVDCSGLKEKAFDDSPTRYVYSTKAYDREWRHPDYVLPIDITDIDEWAECDTGWDVSNEIRYLALGNSYDYPMPNLETMSSKEGRDILIQFAQKDKAGNWGYSHPNYDHYYAHSSVGYYINYDITKPISRIISAPREANYSGSASFGFDDNSADDSTLFCAFSTRLELNNDTDKTSGTYTVVTGYDWSTYQPWLPVSDKSSATFSSLNSSTFWYRCSVKAMDEALNVSDTYDTYYFQCLAPVPNTIIYSGPAGVITDDDGSYDAVFKFRGEGGSITPYEYAYSLNGNTWTDLTTATIHSEPIGYGNHTFRVRARNNGTTDGDTDTTDQTPASVTFTIVNPAQLPNASSPSNPVKYWREESE